MSSGGGQDRCSSAPHLLAGLLSMEEASSPCCHPTNLSTASAHPVTSPSPAVHWKAINSHQTLFTRNLRDLWGKRKRESVSGEERHGRLWELEMKRSRGRKQHKCCLLSLNSFPRWKLRHPSQGKRSPRDGQQGPPQQRLPVLHHPPASSLPGQKVRGLWVRMHESASAAACRRLP